MSATALRGLTILALAAMLAGCNTVYSERPLFTRKDSIGAPVLKPGLWLIRSSGDCAFDETLPTRKWPECADDRGTMIGGPAGKPTMGGQPMVLAAGDPIVAQVRDRDDHGTARYYFAGVQPQAHDAAGRVVAFRWWIARCGPPPSRPSPAAPSEAPDPAKAPPTAGDATKPVPVTSGSYVSPTPLPGLDVRGDDCVARDPKVVRAAVTASPSWPDAGIESAHWVRDR
jgi:hypothetical protein